MMQEVYCELVGARVGLMRSKVSVEVDFGESKGLWQWLELPVGFLA